MSMTAKQRMLTALDGGIPDRLPVTTHFLMPQFLDSCMGGMSEDQFFDTCGWDPITYTTPHRPEAGGREYYDPDQAAPGFLESRRIATDNWRVELEPLAGHPHPATRYRFVTPKGNLTMVLETDPYTAWVAEPLVKEKRDIELIGEYVTAPKCDVAEVNRVAETFGQRGLVRGYICCFERLRPAGDLAGRDLPGGRRADDHGDLRRPGLGPRVSRYPLAAEEGLRRVLGGGPLRYPRTGRGQRLLLGDLAADLRRVRRPLRWRVDRPGGTAPASGSPIIPAAA